MIDKNRNLQKLHAITQIRQNAARYQILNNSIDWIILLVITSLYLSFSISSSLDLSLITKSSDKVSMSGTILGPGTIQLITHKISYWLRKNAMEVQELGSRHWYEPTKNKTNGIIEYSCTDKLMSKS